MILYDDYQENIIQVFLKLYFKCITCNIFREVLKGNRLIPALIDLCVPVITFSGLKATLETFRCLKSVQSAYITY